MHYEHYHAYSYTGKAFSDAQIRRGEAPSNYPPIEIVDRKNPTALLDSLDEAVAWLDKELSGHVPVDAASFPVATRLEYSRAQLQQAAASQVVYGYWSVSGRYVSRQLFPCNGGSDCQA